MVDHAVIQHLTCCNTAFNMLYYSMVDQFIAIGREREMNQVFFFLSLSLSIAMNWSNSTAVIQHGRIRHWFIAIERERLGSFIAITITIAMVDHAVIQHLTCCNTAFNMLYYSMVDQFIAIGREREMNQVFLLL